MIRSPTIPKIPGQFVFCSAEYRKTYSKLRTFTAFDWWQELVRIALQSDQYELNLRQTDSTSSNPQDISNISIPTVSYFASVEQFRFSADDFPAFLVRLNTTDQIIIRDFMDALQKQKDRRGSPVSKPGPKAMNANFDTSTFKVWIAHRIIPLADALIWRADQPVKFQKLITQSKIGESLGYPDDKHTSESKSVLKQAIECIDTLFSQAWYETPERFQ